MKILLLFLALQLAFLAKAQSNTYEESYEVIQMTFDMTMSTSNEAVFIFTAMPENEFDMKMKKDRSSFKEQLANSFESVNCDPCELFQTKITNSPIKFLLAEVEEGDVFAITKADKDYKVEHYREEK